MNKFARFVFVFVLVVFAVMSIVAYAGDRGPQRVSATLALGAGTITPPTGDTGRFVPTYIVFNAPADSTQTVSYVSGAVTNTLATKSITATDKVLALTNAPPMFSGDLLRIVQAPASGTNTANLIGDLWE